MSQNGSSQFGDFKGKGLDEFVGKDVADKLLKLDSGGIVTGKQIGRAHV